MDGVEMWAGVQDCCFHSRYPILLASMVHLPQISKRTFHVYVYSVTIRNKADIQ